MGRLGAPQLRLAGELKLAPLGNVGGDHHDGGFGARPDDGLEPHVEPAAGFLVEDSLALNGRRRCLKALQKPHAPVGKVVEERPVGAVRKEERAAVGFGENRNGVCHRFHHAREAFVRVLDALPGGDERRHVKERADRAEGPSVFVKNGREPQFRPEKVAVLLLCLKAERLRRRVRVRERGLNVGHQVFDPVGVGRFAPEEILRGVAHDSREGFVDVEDFSREVRDPEAHHGGFGHRAAKRIFGSEEPVRAVLLALVVKDDRDREKQHHGKPRDRKVLHAVRGKERMLVASCLDHHARALGVMKERDGRAVVNGRNEGRGGNRRALPARCRHGPVVEEELELVARRGKPLLGRRKKP